jgi:short-subunit dehydrogenase
MRRRKLRDSVIVITGASSGIGRAAALELARYGSTLVLIARRRDALEEVAQQCERRGALKAVPWPADVTDEEAVKEAAQYAIENFGRIDVWVNNAAVSAFGRTEELPTDIFRRVIDVNLYGYLYGARAAVRQFREQGRGVLINVSSMLGRGGAAFLSAYVLTKWAVNGLGESLRQELLDEKNIEVCTVMPASIDTPIFQQAANYTGRAVKPLDPIYEADKVAGAIVRMAHKPKREIYVGAPARLAAEQHHFMPRLYDQTMARMLNSDHFADGYEEPNPGNLFEPMPQHATVSGGWKEDGDGQAGKLLVGAAAAAAVGMVGWRLLRDDD